MSPDALVDRIGSAMLELQAKGAPPRDARVAVLRAVRYAQRMSGHLSPGIQARAFADLLERELISAPAWLAGVHAARREGRYGTEMERAHRDDRWRQGLERAGAVVGPERAQAWNDSLPEAISGWQGS